MKHDNKKRSVDQEKRSAKRVGGRVQKASGSQDFCKGDVRVKGRILIECKCTTKNTFSIGPKLIEKVERETREGEVPAVEVEFQGIFPKKRLYVLPEWAFQLYLDLLKEN